jgi:hypothetical protein
LAFAYSAGLFKPSEHFLATSGRATDLRFDHPSDTVSAGESDLMSEDSAPRKDFIQTLPLKPPPFNEKTLEVPTAPVLVNTKPNGAHVYDSENMQTPLGITPLKRRFTLGKKELIFRLKGYKEGNMVIEVKKGDNEAYFPLQMETPVLDAEPEESVTKTVRSRRKKMRLNPGGPSPRKDMGIETSPQIIRPDDTMDPFNQ